MVPQLGTMIATELAPVLSSSATQGLASVVDGFVNACKMKCGRDVALARIAAQLDTSLAEIRSDTEKALKAMDILDRSLQSMIMKYDLTREEQTSLIQLLTDKIVHLAMN